MSKLANIFTKFKNILIPKEYDLQTIAEGLFTSSEKHPLNYWAFLLISAEIAVFGLIMNSPAVIIGAMLISPLMLPLLQTGMAFAIGNLHLAARAVVRVLASILAVAILTALTTMLMPFHQITPQIDSRTQPTALDLLIAFFVAVVACWTSMRRSDDTITAAAGTAVSISLVPPLCVTGFGLGIMDWDALSGSALLFTANLAAIILVSEIFFITMGFPDIDDEKLEKEVFVEEKRHPVYFLVFRFLDRINRRIFLGMKINIFLPVLFVAVISVPLFRGLSRVVWEVRTSQEINAILDDFSKRYPILDKEQVLKNRHVAVSLTIVADPSQAEELTSYLNSRLQKAVEVEPSLTLEIIPSPEYLRNRFKVQSDLLTKRFSSPGGLHQYVVQNPHRRAQEQGAFCLESLREAMNSVLGWLNAMPTGPEYAGWNLAIHPGGSMLQVLHISDEGMSQDARELAAAYVKKETGIDATVSEKLLPRTVLRFEDNFSAKALRHEADRILNTIEKESAVGVEILLKSATGKRRSEIGKANEAMLACVRSRIPADRIVVNRTDSWGINLFVIKENLPPGSLP